MKGAVLMAAILAGAVLAALAIGEVSIAPADLLRDAWNGEGPGALAIRVVRGPRVATALGAGALFGVSGALVQRLFRNPLASPDILGFDAGAGLAAIVGVILGTRLPMPLVSAGGGIVAALLVGLLAWRPGRPTPAPTLVLVGLGVGFSIGAVASFLTLSLPTAAAAEAQRWLTGSLAARDWGHAEEVWMIGAVLVALVLLQWRALQLLDLGPDLAVGLGLRVGLARYKALGTAVLLAAVAVAVAGPVPFVALMAPRLGAFMTGARGEVGELAAAGVAGAAICVLADLAARAAIPGLALPIGAATGLLGAPYLLWHLSREMGRGRL